MDLKDSLLSDFVFRRMMLAVRGLALGPPHGRGRRGFVLSYTPGVDRRARHCLLVWHVHPDRVARSFAQAESALESNDSFVS